MRPDLVSLIVRGSAGLAALIAVVAVLTSAGPPSRPPDVFVLMVDTLRPDHVGAYGYPRATTPNLDRFAQSAVLFEDAVSTSSWTLPAIGSIFTGTYPQTHGLLAHRTGPLAVQSLRQEIPTLAEVLRAAGYATVGVVTNTWLSTKTGGDRGFDSFRVRRENTRASIVNEIAAAEVDQIPNDRPIFVYLHYMDVHQPYWVAPDGESIGPVRGADLELSPAILPHAQGLLADADWRSQTRSLGDIVDAYDRGIRYWDRTFGGWLAWLRSTGRLANSIICVLSDHGEQLNEHGGWGHGTALHEEQARVAWILRLPDQRGSRRVRARVSLIDVAPTILGHLGLTAALGEIDGTDVLQPVPARDLFAESKAYRGTWHGGNVIHQAVWRGSRKLLRHHTRFSTYDLVGDPKEKRPQTADDDMSAALVDWATRQEERVDSLADPERHPVDESLRERLRALGYE